MGIIEPGLYWLIIGVMLFFLELALPGFILFFFALGALITALAAWLFSISIVWQLALFIVASLVSLFTLRNFIQTRFLGSEDNTFEDPDVKIAVPGRQGVVSVAILPPGEGQIKYSGSFWRATAEEEIGEGEVVVIIKQDNLIVHVEKVEPKGVVS